jgi:PAS domain S-box-containing protein
VDHAIVRALDELGQGLLVFRGQQILAVSDGLCRIVGRERAQLLELESVFELIAPEHRERLQERLRLYLRGEVVPDHIETTIVAGDGSRRDVELAVKSAAVPGAGSDTDAEPDRRAPTLVTIVRDVTTTLRNARFARILADASEIVAGANDDDAIPAIVRLLVPAVADWCAFDRHESDGSLTRVAVSHVSAAGEALLWELDRRFPVRRFEGNLRARVLRTGKPLVMNDMTDAGIRAIARNTEHADMLREVGIGSALWVPASSLGRTVGVISLGRAGMDRPFQEDVVDLATRLGHRAAQAIERRAADRTIRDRERQQSAVAELGRLALAGMAPDALHERAVRLLADTLEVEYAAALELRPGGSSLRVLAAAGWSPAATMLGDEIPLEAASQAAYTLSSGGPVLVDDLRTETRFVAPPVALGLGAVSGLSVVIGGHGDHPYGVLSVHAARRRRFDGDDVNFVLSAAHVLATAIERRESEVALRESDARLHLALAASQVGTWEWDLRSGTLRWSDEIRRQHGFAAGAPVPTFDEYLQLVHPDDRELFQRTVGAAINGEPYDLDYRFLLPSGEVRWTNGQGRVFTDDAGNPVRMVGTGRDITDRKATEQERDGLLEQERTARQLREAFIGVLSHELRTPITTILGGARILADRLDRMPHDAAAGLLDDIEQEAERLARLIEDLLVLTRSERGNIDVRDDPVLPGVVVDAVVSSSAVLAQRVHLDIQVPRNLPIVIGDETYLEQILRNLVGNAAKFSPAGSTVSIRSEVTPSEVVLRVLDEGPGIEPSETERLFEVFYRSPRTRSKAAGSGIGLFVARQLAGAMGGRLWAVPRPEGGAEFGIALRRHELPSEDPEAGADAEADIR